MERCVLHWFHQLRVVLPLPFCLQQEPRFKDKLSKVPVLVRSVTMTISISIAISQFLHYFAIAGPRPIQHGDGRVGLEPPHTQHLHRHGDGTCHDPVVHGNKCSHVSKCSHIFQNIFFETDVVVYTLDKVRFPASCLDVQTKKGKLHGGHWTRSIVLFGQRGARHGCRHPSTAHNSRRISAFRSQRAPRCLQRRSPIFRRGFEPRRIRVW